MARVENTQRQKYIFPQGASKNGKAPKPSKLIALIYKKVFKQEAYRKYEK